MDVQRFSVLLSPNFRFSASYYITDFQCSACRNISSADPSSPQPLYWYTGRRQLFISSIVAKHLPNISPKLYFSGALLSIHLYFVYKHCTLFFRCILLHSVFLELLHFLLMLYSVSFFFFFPFFFFFMLCFPVQFRYTQLCCCFSGARPF